MKNFGALLFLATLSTGCTLLGRPPIDNLASSTKPLANSAVISSSPETPFTTSPVPSTVMPNNIFTPSAEPGERFGAMTLETIESAPLANDGYTYAIATFRGNVTVTGTISTPAGSTSPDGFTPLYTMGNLTEQSRQQLPYFEYDTRTVWFAISNPTVITAQDIQDGDLVEVTIDRYNYDYQETEVSNSAHVLAVQKVSQR